MTMMNDESFHQLVRVHPSCVVDDKRVDKWKANCCYFIWENIVRTEDSFGRIICSDDSKNHRCHPPFFGCTYSTVITTLSKHIVSLPTNLYLSVANQ